MGETYFAIEKPVPIGRVIRISDKYTLLIDAGADQLATGDSIKVYEIVDTVANVSGKILAYYIHVKDTLMVVEVAEKCAICQKPVENVLDQSHTSASFSHELAELPVNEKEIIAFKIDNTIHVRDLVMFE